MAITLYNLKPAKGSRRKRKRLGRGDGSGHGSYSCRGQKGQRSRAGGKGGLKLKGFKNIIKSIPKKRGFKSRQTRPEIVNLAQLQKKFKSGDTVSPETLLKKSLIDNIKGRVKILAKGELKKKLTIEGCALSGSAEKQIKKVGGYVK
jgi:large subunit ribosomal protein L15